MQVVTYDSKYRAAFKDLNEAWISRFFSIEEKDSKQLSDPESCIRDGGQIFFVLSDEQPVATCALYFEAEGVYELAKMAVDDRYKGQGISNLMMKAIEDWVLAQGGFEIFLLSNSSLEAAMGLYQKHGYEVFHRGQHPEYDRADIGMRKVLQEKK